MSSHIIILENIKDWKETFPDVELMSASNYLAGSDERRNRTATFINLCRSYRYLSSGYYCSLLAEARNQRIIPTVRTITDLSSKTIYSLNAEELDEAVQRACKKNSIADGEREFGIYIFFGNASVQELGELTRQIFELFRSPLLKVQFKLDKKWQIDSIKPLSLNMVPDELTPFFSESLTLYMGKQWRSPKVRQIPKYDLAILYNPEEELAPSKIRALNRFMKAGKKYSVDVELIQKKDFSRLAEFDALFIRETTNINHHTYRFAKRAENYGIPVIDDPDSIVKCTNKVYLAELLQAQKIPVLKTVILQKSIPMEEQLVPEFPLVLKIPDGSFSRGVLKAENHNDFRDITDKLFKESDLILAQEFLYTKFDWRVGILNRKPLFVSKYFMYGSHWQIVKHSTGNKFSEGNAQTLLVEDAPEEVVELALKGANLIGDGLYGVDIKETDKGTFIIEVNDNPNIDVGVEDKCLGDELYESIIREFIRRIEE